VGVVTASQVALVPTQKMDHRVHGPLFLDIWSLSGFVLWRNKASVSQC